MAYALNREINGRWNFLCNDQELVPPDSNIHIPVDIRPPHRPRIYGFRCLFSPDETLTLNVFHASHYPGVTFTYLLPFPGKNYWTRAFWPERNDSLYAELLPDHWRDARSIQKQITSQGELWGEWSIELEMHETDAGNSDGNYHESAFYRFRSITGDPARFLSRSFLHNWVVERLAPSPPILSNPQFFDSPQDEANFARSYFCHIECGVFFMARHLHWIRLEYELVDPGLNDWDVYVHEGAGETWGIWRSRVSRRNNRYILDQVVGPDLDKWFAYMKDRVLR